MERPKPFVSSLSSLRTNSSSTLTRQHFPAKREPTHLRLSGQLPFKGKSGPTKRA